MINTLKKFISIKTIANDKEANLEGIQLVKDLLEKIGFTISIEGDSPYNQPVIIAKYTNLDSSKKVTLYNHYDVEKINKKEKWKTDPFVLTETDGRYYARGIADNKGILICRIFALLEMKEKGLGIPNILWIIQGEEEVAGKTPFDVIPKHIAEFGSKIYVEETGVNKGEIPVIFYLPITKKQPSFLTELNSALYNGDAIFDNRSLSKFTKCPFVSNIPEDGFYIGFGPNDGRCNIHRENESLDMIKLEKHKQVFTKFIQWINKTEI
ncbi:M20/M25/M40 family metallo-hydrolase [Winogradskyella pacifica]|uniref:M20/M25/M40 family metallo-hydrolase n=1 Tax=Winogradskyella pacifica TaxID=664642 RepID=UPI0015CA475B|nr:M20/M25/M40 family metallo-hydrolase [Winogradskyella pacifica]